MILSANLTLREEEVRDRIRPIWAVLIRCGKLMLENSHDSAKETAAGMIPYMTTQRITQAALSHIVFLVSALDKKDLIQEYNELFQPKMEE